MAPDGSITLDLQPTAREAMPSLTRDATQARSIEFARGFTEEQARREASRCLRCDLSYRCPTIHVITPERAKRTQASPS
jgi:hypothetical protein